MKRKPHWAEDLVTTPIDEKKIQCKDCALRERNNKKDAFLGSCMAYTRKPVEILFDGEDCPYYIKED